MPREERVEFMVEGRLVFDTDSQARRGCDFVVAKLAKSFGSSINIQEGVFPSFWGILYVGDSGRELPCRVFGVSH